MQKLIAAAGLLALAMLSAGCESYDHSQGTRQEGDYSAQPAKEPFSPIPGDTTGDGLRRDRRTGGGVGPGSVTGQEQIRDQDRLRGNNGGPQGNEGTPKNPPSGNQETPGAPSSGAPGNIETGR